MTNYCNTAAAYSISQFLRHRNYFAMLSTTVSGKPS